MNLSIGQNRLVIIAALAFAAAILFVPARQFLAQRHQISVLETSLRKLHTEDVALSGESKRLSDPNELELLARQRLGLVRPGERAYFIEPSAVPHKPAGAAVVHHPSFLGRAWHWLSTRIRGGN